MKLTEGDDAPEFEAVDQHGDLHSLEDYKGKLLLLYFYPRDNTPGCTAEACGFRDNYEELNKFVKIIGVSGNSRESHLKFSNNHDLPFPLLVDQNKEIIRAYGANGLIYPKRVSFLINRQGIIVKIYEKVKPAEHADEIMEDLADFL